MNDDTISRRAAIDAFMTATSDGDKAEWCRWVLKQLPSAQPEQPTLYGYNIEHLAQIAILLREENLPPERVAEALTDIGKIVSIVRAECEEGFRKAVERCMI
jgi:hypothetical protein